MNVPLGSNCWMYNGIIDNNVRNNLVTPDARYYIAKFACGIAKEPIILPFSSSI